MDPMSTVMSGGVLLLIMIVSWLVPIAFAIWLIMSVNEIKKLLREIRTELSLRD